MLDADESSFLSVLEWNVSVLQKRAVRIWNSAGVNQTLTAPIGPYKDAVHMSRLTQRGEH